MAAKFGRGVWANPEPEGRVQRVPVGVPQQPACCPGDSLGKSRVLK